MQSLPVTCANRAVGLVALVAAAVAVATPSPEARAEVDPSMYAFIEACKESRARCAHQPLGAECGEAGSTCVAGVDDLSYCALASGELDPTPDYGSGPVIAFGSTPHTPSDCSGYGIDDDPEGCSAAPAEGRPASWPYVAITALAVAVGWRRWLA